MVAAAAEANQGEEKRKRREGEIKQLGRTEQTTTNTTPGAHNFWSGSEITSTADSYETRGRPTCAQGLEGARVRLPRLY